jgi:hypothetical protein
MAARVRTYWPEKVFSGQKMVLAQSFSPPPSPRILMLMSPNEKICCNSSPIRRTFVGTGTHMQISYVILLKRSLFPFAHLINGMPFIFMPTHNIWNKTDICQKSFPIAFPPVSQVQAYTHLKPSLIQLLRKQTPDKQFLCPLLIAKY